MKKKYFLLLFLCLFSSVNAQIISFSDVNFKAKLLEADVTNTIAKDSNGMNVKIDINGDGEIEQSEAELIYKLNISNSEIYSLEGIQNFTMLNSLSCSKNKISSLDVIKNIPNLYSLDCSENLLIELDIRKLIKLSTLNCVMNQLISLNVSGLSNLYYLECGANQLITINASGCSNLSSFYFSENPNLATLNLTDCTALSDLKCENLKLIELNITGCKSLKTLKCSNNKLNKLHLNGLTNLTAIECTNNQLTEISLNSVPNITKLFASNNLLVSLDFTNLASLKTLDCSKNQLTQLDLSNLTELTELDCSLNSIYQLDLKGLIQLNNLYCNNNQLNTISFSDQAYLNRLDISNNKLKNLSLSGQTYLHDLNCSNNEISTLDLRGLMALSYLTCSSNKLSSLYVKNNRVKNLDFSNNPTITYICVDDEELVNVQQQINQYGYTNCNIDSSCSLKNANVFIKDFNFKTLLLNSSTSNNIARDINKIPVKIDMNNDGEIQFNEIQNVAYLDVSGASITDLNGILSFEKLAELNCANNQISSLDLVGLINITDLNCSKNQLTELKIEGISGLEKLNLSNNKLKDFTSTSVYFFPNLKFLDCSNNAFSHLDFNPLNKIETLLCNNNQLIGVNFIDLKNLINVNCANNNFQTIDFKGLANITILDCSNNNLKTLNISDQIKLETIKCDNNSLISLYLKNGFNQTIYSFNGNPSLTYICADEPRITSIKNLITSYGNINCLTYTDCAYNDIVYIPDAKFKAKLLDFPYKTASNANDEYIVVDTNKNGEIEISEALTVYKLNLISCDIKSLEGILKFTNINRLWCGFNRLTTLDVSELTELEVLNCDQNSITTLNVTGLKKLKNFSCSSNKIESLNLSASKDLIDLNTSGNYISSLNIKGLTKLESLEIKNNTFAKGATLDLSEFVNLRDIDCRSMLVTGLSIPNSPKIEWLDCSLNWLTNIDVSSLTKLKTFDCSSNKLTTLNVSNSTNLSTLYCNSNRLESLFIKIGKKITNLNFASNYNLNFICTDESQIETVRSMPLTPGFYPKNVNSYCSFTPGGTYYTINGSSKFDLNSNGCDEQDILIPNIKFNIVNGVNKSEFISDQSGRYNLPVGDGTYSISPKFENLNYFKVSPESITVTFPAETSPSLQNFCISPNGIHKDLEISLVPIEAARPGFDASYKIIYKNKGNITQSGTINLVFNDAVLDIISSNPVFSNQLINNVTWNFIDLKPFESREIKIVLNVNSPIETPAVNNDDILSYIATINSPQIDETSNDNTFTLNQKVVGSYDPNDKTCLEGDIITSALMGEYVHYLIRFENTGTYPAQNVVVKDIIDLSKFDISTLMPTSASHPYVTKISNGNKVEFIFENIQLPYDGMNNNGYIAFKIKTLPTLKVGDSFQNEASIYFDYNFPILTNKATSTFKTLGLQDFEFSNYLTVYPVPADEVLNITVKNDIEIKSIAVYNLLGQLIIAFPNAQNINTIDLSSLKTGTYILNITSDKGISNRKFIKK